MDLEIARNLVEDFSDSKKIIPLNKDKLTQVLASTDTPLNREFYKEIPNNSQTLFEAGIIYSLSLRKILKNKTARNNYLTSLGKLYMTTASKFKKNTLDKTLLKIQSTPWIMQLFNSCNQPFSLLGEFNSYETNTKTNSIEYSSRPILFIPKTKNNKKISKWEESNTTYQKEFRLFGILPLEINIKHR